MMKMIKGAWWIMWFQNHVKCWERSMSVLWFRKSRDTIVMLLLVMCLARPEAPGQAMPCQSRPGQARPCSTAWRGFWPGSSLMRPEPSPQALASVVYILWKIGIRITCRNTKTYLMQMVCDIFSCDHCVLHVTMKMATWIESNGEGNPRTTTRQKVTASVKLLDKNNSVLAALSAHQQAVHDHHIATALEHAHIVALDSTSTSGNASIHPAMLSANESCSSSVHITPPPSLGASCSSSKRAASVVDVTSDAKAPTPAKRAKGVYYFYTWYCLI